MAGLTPTRGLVSTEDVLDVAKLRGLNGGRGLVANELIRKRYVRPRRYFSPLGTQILVVTDIPEVVMAVMQPA